MATEVDDIIVRGTLTRRGPQTPVPRTDLSQESYAAFDIPITDMRIWDSASFAPLTTPAVSDDDLGFGAGTYGTNVAYISAGSLGSVGAKTRYCRFLLRLPLNYVAGQTLRVAILAGITGGTPNVADATCTVDLQAFKFGSNVAAGSDVVSTAVTTMNTTTFTTVNFDWTATGLIAGDMFDCRITIVCTDAGSTAANVVPAITKLTLECAIKG